LLGKKKKSDGKIHIAAGPEQDSDANPEGCGGGRALSSARRSEEGDDDCTDRGSATGAAGVVFTRSRMIIRKVIVDELSEKLRCGGSDVQISVRVSGIGDEDAVVTSDTQKCVGDSLLWRFDPPAIPPNTEMSDKKDKRNRKKKGKGKGTGGGDGEPMAVDVVSSSSSTVSFSLHDTKHPDEPEASVTISGSDVFLSRAMKEEDEKEGGDDSRGSLVLHLRRNDVTRLANLSVEFMLQQS
jgi:hypothetical protein